MASNKALGYVALSATSILWGTTWIASKYGVREMTGLQLAGMRQFIAGSMIVGFFLLFRKKKLPDRSQFMQLMVMTLLMFVIANSVSTWSLHYISTGLGALIGALYPLMVVLLERFFFGRKRIPPLTVLGLLLGIAGVGIVFYDHLLEGNVRSLVLGIGMAFVATFSWSIGTILVTKNDTGLNAYYSIGWQMLISSVLVIIITWATQPIVPVNEISSAGWMSLFFLIIIGSVIAFSAFIYSMKVLPHSVASLFAYINPLVAMFLGSVMLKEKLSPHIIVGSLVTLAGVFLVNYSSRKSEAVIAEPEI